MRYDPDRSCPACQSRRVVVGETETVFDGLARGFRPRGLRRSLFSDASKRVRLTDGVFACLDCGLTWSWLDRESLRETLVRWGEFFDRDRLGLVDPKSSRGDEDELA